VSDATLPAVHEVMVSQHRSQAQQISEAMSQVASSRQTRRSLEELKRSPSLLTRVDLLESGESRNSVFRRGRRA